MSSKFYTDARDAAAMEAEEAEEKKRKNREYRVGLNIFNKGPPERGVKFLMERGHVVHNNQDLCLNLPLLVAKFLILTSSDGQLTTRGGLSKQMIGRYLGTGLEFNGLVLKHVMNMIDLTGLSVEQAMRRFLKLVHLHGESQDVQRLVQAFADRYCECNDSQSDERQNMTQDDVFLLSYSIIVLNTDLHNKNVIKHMTSEEFVRRTQDCVSRLDEPFIRRIFQQIQLRELTSGADHMTIVQNVQKQLLPGDKMFGVTVINGLVTPDRRFTSRFRVTEVRDMKARSRRGGRDERRIFLFNDLLIFTKKVAVEFPIKVLSLGKGHPDLTSDSKLSHVDSYDAYIYRASYSLCDIQVTRFSVPYHRNGIQFLDRRTSESLLSFNVENEDACEKIFDAISDYVEEAILTQSSVQSFKSKNQENGRQQIHANVAVGKDGSLKPRNK